jgi:hypothetical protein
MQNKPERSMLEQVAEVAQAEQWDKATKKRKQKFPGDCLNIGQVKEFLEKYKWDSLTSIIKWVGQLDVQLQPRAYEALYEQFKVNKFTDQPKVLLLRKRVQDLPAGVLANVRAQLDQDFERIVGHIAEGVKRKDYSLQKKINKMKKPGEVMNEVVTAVVGKFVTCTLESTLLLIEYSEELPTIGNSCYLINALLRLHGSRLLLLHSTDHAMIHIWAHVKFIVEEQPNWKKVPIATQKLCTDVLEKLTKHKLKFFQHYQKFVEVKDKEKIKKFHERNLHVCSIVSEFVSWYYIRDDLTRFQNLLSAARAINNLYAIQRILTQLQVEMHKFQQTNTFEAFRLFHEVKYYMKLDTYKSLHPKWKLAFEELKAKAPTCLRLLLWSEGDENQLQIVNKLFDSSLSVHQDRIVCSSASLGKVPLQCHSSLPSARARSSGLLLGRKLPPVTRISGGRLQPPKRTKNQAISIRAAPPVAIAIGASSSE